MFGTSGAGFLFRVVLVLPGLLQDAGGTPPGIPAPPLPSLGTPVLIHGIKYTDPSQGASTKDTCLQLGIETVPIAYHGGVDFDADGVIDDWNRRQFAAWVTRNVPEGYRGPVVLDYEQPWWKELNARDTSPARVDEILKVYCEGLAYASRLRPEADWGYWGLPSMRHLDPGWQVEGRSVDSVLAASGALFPAAYDCDPGGSSRSFGVYVTRCLRQVNADTPLYVYLNVRFCGQGGDHSRFLPVEELLENARAVLSAAWTDLAGRKHRARGIVLWDNYGWEDEERWTILDQRIAGILRVLQEVIHREYSGSG